MRRWRSGFTLIEILICVAIMGLLLSAASIPFGTWVRSSRLRHGTDLVIGVLRDAQVRAFRDGTPWRVRVRHDGRELYLESATATFGVEWTCTTGSWSSPEAVALPPGVSIDIQRSSEPCVIFGSNGRVLNRGPWVSQPKTVPNSRQSIMTLTDGHSLSKQQVEEFGPIRSYTDPSIVSWRADLFPEIRVDLRHLRYVESLRIGFIAQRDAANKLIFPSPVANIIVRGTTVETPTAQDFTIDFLEDVAPLERPTLPANPTGNTARHGWLTIPINQQIRHVRIQFVPASTVKNQYWGIDEIDFGPRFFQVKVGNDLRYVEINPTTGRVTVRGSS